MGEVLCISVANVGIFSSAHANRVKCLASFVDLWHQNLTHLHTTQCNFHETGLNLLYFFQKWPNLRMQNCTDPWNFCCWSGMIWQRYNLYNLYLEPDAVCAVFSSLPIIGSLIIKPTDFLIKVGHQQCAKYPPTIRGSHAVHGTSNQPHVLS